MRTDPFEGQTDMSGYPRCIACISYCPMKIPWRNPSGEIQMRCSSPIRNEIFQQQSAQKDDRRKMTNDNSPES